MNQPLESIPLVAVVEEDVSNENLLNDDNNDRHCQKETCCSTFCLSLIKPFVDSSGSYESVLSGLSIIAVIGIILGVSMPKSSNLSGAYYPTISSCIGYTYFVAWSGSFYPQVLTNLERRSTEGLSTDFSIVNLVGHVCYMVYNAALYWSQSIQEEYQQRHHNTATSTVESNDVAFSIHAVTLSCIWIVQIYHYGGFNTHPISCIMQWLILTILLVCCSFALLVSLHWTAFTWLDVLYLLSFMKVIITIAKCIPQVILNAKRKSTVGWSLWNVIMGLTGGALSLLQLVLDSWNKQDWSGITGNLAKLGLAFVNLLFDAIFLVQHYILYPSRGSNGH